jgi:hypothetical protein
MPGKQQVTGLGTRVCKGFDAWVAYEIGQIFGVICLLRRAAGPAPSRASRRKTGGAGKVQRLIIVVVQRGRPLS